MWGKVSEARIPWVCTRAQDASTRVLAAKSRAACAGRDSRCWEGGEASARKAVLVRVGNAAESREEGAEREKGSDEEGKGASHVNNSILSRWKVLHIGDGWYATRHSEVQRRGVPEEPQEEGNRVSMYRTCQCWASSSACSERMSG